MHNSIPENLVQKHVDRKLTVIHRKNGVFIPKEVANIATNLKVSVSLDSVNKKHLILDGYVAKDVLKSLLLASFDVKVVKGLKKLPFRPDFIK